MFRPGGGGNSTAGFLGNHFELEDAMTQRQRRHQQDLKELIAVIDQEQATLAKRRQALAQQLEALTQQRAA
jgi:uncharacterized protein YlxW (UPF0749 family)